ncbi:MAG: nuclear transport factor 2 family protein [Flavobacteriales bacterium]|nr:nuclear transport factor 2 family protein [Flavobacteriales bacterium]MDW8431696.1 nuclear transport factor 2 family protein [Flavobacteriales bacterium]
MRIKIISVVLLFGSGIVIPCPWIWAQKNSIQVILNRLQEAEAAWNSGHLEGFMNAYWRHDSLCFATDKGLTRGWHAVLERYRKAYPDAQTMGRLKFEVLYLKVQGSCAVMTGRWTVDKVDQPTRSGMFTLVWRRLKKQWHIVYDHTSG